MCSRRDACESITTRLRLRPPAAPPAGAAPAPRRASAPDCAPFEGAESEPSGGVAFLPSAFGAGAAGFASAAAPSAPVACRALSASASSTLDAATFASIPAALRAASTSLLLSP